MKHFIRALLVFVLLISLGGCIVENGQQTVLAANKGTGEPHVKIGVAVYNTKDPEVIAFRNYYEHYVGDCFDVEFVYSNSIQSVEEEIQFIEEMAEKEIGGVISFTSRDLTEIMKVCEEKKIYYMRGSGSISDELYESVKDNPWYIGSIGPGSEMEYSAAKEMAQYFIEKTSEKDAVSYLIFTGGAVSGNVMHQYRSEAILARIGADPALAMSEVVTETTCNLGTAIICPGLFVREETREEVKRVLSEHSFDVIMSSLSVAGIMDLLKAAKADNNKKVMIGVVDCFTEENMKAFNDKLLHYMTGKYASMIGPAFCFMYNALTGHAEEYRNSDGTAVRIPQGFWMAAGKKEYEKLYNLTINEYVNAYSKVDLAANMKYFSPDADLERLIKLTEAYTEEDVKKRCGY